MKCVALMYHDIVAPGDDDASSFPGAAAAHYKLDVDAFARHLDALAASGPRFGPVDSRANGPQCALTFDDGGPARVGRKPRRGVPPNDTPPHYHLCSPAATSNAPSPPQSRG